MPDTFGPPGFRPVTPGPQPDLQFPGRGIWAPMPAYPGSLWGAQPSPRASETMAPPAPRTSASITIPTTTAPVTSPPQLEGNNESPEEFIKVKFILTWPLLTVNLSEPVLYGC